MCCPLRQDGSGRRETVAVWPADSQLAARVDRRRKFFFLRNPLKSLDSEKEMKANFLSFPFISLHELRALVALHGLKAGGLAGNPAGARHWLKDVACVAVSTDLSRFVGSKTSLGAATAPVATPAATPIAPVVNVPSDSTRPPLASESDWPSARRSPIAPTTSPLANLPWLVKSLEAVPVRSTTCTLPCSRIER